MATVVQFKVKLPREPKLYMSPHETAEIVIFPGIRYERWCEAQSQSVDEPAVTRGRDHLELDA